MQIACFVYKAMHCLLPPCFNDYFVLNSSTYCYNLRNNDNVKRYNSRTNVRFYFIKWYGPKIWNDIDSFIRNSPSIYVFRRRLRISIYLNMFNDLIMFWTLIKWFVFHKLGYMYMFTTKSLLRLVLNISFGFLDLFLFSLFIYTGWYRNKFWFDLIWY